MASAGAPDPGSTTRYGGALSGLGRACARHPWRVIGLWVVAIVLIIGASGTIGGMLVDEFTIPDSDTQRAIDLLEERFPERSGDTAQVVFAVETGRLDEGERRQAVLAALSAAEAIEDVESVGNPFEGPDGQLSDDGKIAFADALFTELSFEVDTASVDQLKEDVQGAVRGQRGTSRVHRPSDSELGGPRDWY